MIKLREFQKEDAKQITTWVRDERAFRKWCANVLPEYPVKPQHLVDLYEDVTRRLADNFVPVVAYDENGLVGQLFLRLLEPENGLVRIGLVIVDEARRGQGYGQQMMKAALTFAQSRWQVKRVTLGVFANNPGAHRCYEAAGFSDQDRDPILLEFLGEQWECIEMEYFM